MGWVGSMMDPNMDPISLLNTNPDLIHDGPNNCGPEPAPDC